MDHLRGYICVRIWIELVSAHPPRPPMMKPPVRPRSRSQARAPVSMRLLEESSEARADPPSPSRLARRDRRQPLRIQVPCVRRPGDDVPDPSMLGPGEPPTVVVVMREKVHRTELHRGDLFDHPGRGCRRLIGTEQASDDDHQSGELSHAGHPITGGGPANDGTSNEDAAFRDPDPSVPAPETRRTPGKAGLFSSGTNLTRGHRFGTEGG